MLTNKKINYLEFYSKKTELSYASALKLVQTSGVNK